MGADDAPLKGKALSTIRDLYGRGDVVLSFEVFPPKTPRGFDGLYQVIEELAVHQPGFISVTYGAGGSTQSQSLDIVREVRSRFSLPTTAHFTLVGSTVDDIHQFLRSAREMGTNNIMALRGDPPKGQSTFQQVAGGLAHANELVALIREHYPEFGIGVAGYPETHVEATGPDDDLQYLVQKVNAGGDAVFTQLFYDNSDFYRFRDRCAAAGVSRPIIPGLLPVLSLAQVERITQLCGSKLPADLRQALADAGDDAAAQIQVGIDFCARQVRDLLEQGVPGIHFYVLNRSDSVKRILSQVFV